ncbi:MAG: flavin reductase family protein [Acidimicrobiales bacterium]
MAQDSDLNPEIDSGDFRNVLGHLPTGVTVVTAAGAERPIGVAIGSFVSISLDPPLVGFFLGTGSGSGKPMEESGHFCVNILCQDQMELCGVMASKADDKFEGVAYESAPGSGAPILPDVHAVIDCRIHEVVEAGDHNLIIGRVLSLESKRDAPPMVFYKGQYGSFAG